MNKLCFGDLESVNFWSMKGMRLDLGKVQVWSKMFKNFLNGAFSGEWPCILW